MVYLDWMSTASFITFNKKGVKNVFRVSCFNCIIGNTKLIQHRFIKSFVFELGRICHSEKRIKDVSIERLKQKLGLENN